MVTSCVESLVYEQICLKMVTLYLIRSIHTWNKLLDGYPRNTERNPEFCFQLTGLNSYNIFMKWKIKSILAKIDC